MAFSINYTNDMRNELVRKYARNEINDDGTVELQCVSWRCTEDAIIGKANQAYIAAEIEWYESQSLSVDDLADIYGKRVQIWDQVSDKDGFINSNYGWCIYSAENGRQYRNVLKVLQKNPNSRHGTMHYTRPFMHAHAKANGMSDFMCTFATQYYVNKGYLEVGVYMRSQDAVFGHTNDLAWQKHVLHKLAKDLDLIPGSITWHSASLHVYPRHHKLLKDYM